MYQNEEHRKIVNERGDNYIYLGSYHWNEVTIDGKNQNKNKIYIRVICPYCGKEYDIGIYSFRDGASCKNCCNKYENSFAYYIQMELKRGLNEFWNWEKNEINPYCISKGNGKKVILKCDKTDYHDDYEVEPYSFLKGCRCPYCSHFHGKVHPKDSFGQWLIDTYGEGAIKKYWSPKNTLDPFEVAPKTNKKIWILCQEKGYHNDYGGYETIPVSFIKGARCPYCCNHHGKVHKLDSFGSLYPDKAKYWSKNNKKSPFEVTSYTSKKYKFICEKCGEEFTRGLDKLNRNDIGVICSECNSSSLEQKTKNVLERYNIKYYKEYIFNDLIGVGNKNLRFDFYLPQYNTLIECQGEQHKRWIKGWQTKKDFEDLQIHDKRKKEYCKKNNIKLIEVWHYEIDKIEKILIKELKLI